MARTHTVEETITESVARGDLVKWLKDTGRIPKEWEYCSIHITQNSAGQEPLFTIKRSYNKDPTK